MSILLRACALNKYFTQPVRFHVLKDIDLQVSTGEFVSVMGKSGCGKSTLLYLLSTMDTEYEGELFFRGQRITGEPATALARLRNEHIGFVFQFHYLLPEFTVLDNVMLPARKLGRKSRAQIEQDARHKLALLDIEHLAPQLARRLSGGEKQRVAIARALINDPDIIMGDEPTGNLDSRNSDNVFRIFQQLAHQQNLSLLIVTHDTDFARRTDRIIEMEDGRIVG